MAMMVASIMSQYLEKQFTSSGVCEDEPWSNSES